MNDVLDIIAAKSDSSNNCKWLPFKAHSLDTAGIIERLFYSWLPDNVRNFFADSLFGGVSDEALDCALNYCKLAALLHDIGKITPAFQGKISNNIEGCADRLERAGLPVNNIAKESFAHAAAGKYILLLNDKFPKRFADIIGLHHGGAASDGDFDIIHYGEKYYGKKKAQTAAWEGIWREWEEFSLRETCFASPADVPNPSIKAQMIVVGLLIMADWIASNTEYFPYIGTGEVLSDEDIAKRADYAWEKLGLLEPWCPGRFSDSGEYFGAHFGFSPNSVQRDFLRAVGDNPHGGLYILEAPMGIGKTEAALTAAELLAGESGLGGVYFGLPTQATANGIFTRIHDWLGKSGDVKHSVRLAHGMVELNDEYESIFRGTANNSGDDSVIVHEWFEGRKQALLSDFVVATVDQFLLASLKQKHVMLRHLGLAGKAVIIDECHSYSEYMNIYLDSTLRWMGAYNVPVIIMSATLPPKRRAEIVKAYLNKSKPVDIESAGDEYAYPCVTYLSGYKAIRRELSFDGEQRKISVTQICDDGIAAEVSSKLENGGCAAVIVNTVVRAQNIARVLRKVLTDYTVICFHSRFIASDRAKIENEVLKRAGKHSDKSTRDKLIIVGTQVIEQSLDLDFDYMITDLCPMDLLLQRLGRLHRHNRPRPKGLEQAELAVMFPENKIYSDFILERTKKFLPEKLTIPRDIPRLVADTYEEPSEEEKAGEICAKYIREIDDKKEMAKEYCISSNKIESKRDSLFDLIVNGAENSEEAEATVRDGEDTIETLVLRRESEQKYSLMSGGRRFDATAPLDYDEGKAIARERVRLPLWISKYKFKKTVDELDKIPKMWRESQWLKGELLLIFDENGEAKLAGRRLRYTAEYGLETINEQE